MLQERFLLCSNRKQRNKSLIGEYFESGFKKKCCPNVAAPVEIKITLTTSPLLCISLLSIFSDCSKEGHQMHNVHKFSLVLKAPKSPLWFYA